MLRHSVIHLTALLGATLALSTLSHAQTMNEEIVVTATRVPQKLDKIGSSITVITEADLKLRQAVIVSDLLSQTLGISVTRNGGLGGATSLRIRGAETDQTVVIIDGVKLNDPSSVGGGYNFGNLLVGDISRIEVLRGAQSTLWGSQAIGGVVNIVSAAPSSALEGTLENEGGSRATASIKGALGGKTDRATWRVAGSQYTTNGTSAFATGREKDGLRNTGLSGRATVNLTDAVAADARAVYSKSRNGFDGFPPPTFAFADTGEYGFTKELVTYAGLNADVFDGRLQNRVGYGQTDTDRDNFNPAQANTTRTFDGKGKNKRWEYQGILKLNNAWSATVGLEDEKSSLRTASPSAFNPAPVPVRNQVGLTSGYVQVQGDVADGLAVTGGLRHDDHDTFGNQTLGQAAAAWTINDGATVLRASFGQGFKAPTLFQLFSNFGNRALRPEEADSWDGGVEHRMFDGAVVVSMTGFTRATKNQIDFVGCPSANPFCRAGIIGVYDNIARTKASGVEFGARAQVDTLSIQANYTYTDTENTSPGNINRGKNLARRPKDTLNVNATYVWPYDISTGVSLQYVGKSFDNAANSFVLKSYTLVDVRISAPVNETFEVFGRIENLFDETYQTTRNYGSPGRGAFAGVRARF
jgi:vitamin B12 transporter